MKSTDFNLPQELNFNFDSGVHSFRDTRLIMVDSNALGLLRQQVIERLGMEQARNLYLRFGYQQGFADFMNVKSSYQFESELELLRFGPFVQTWEGVVKAIPDEVRYDRSSGDFYFSATCLNCYEAEQHLSFNDKALEAVCWSMAGYASGWCSGFFGTKVIAIEHSCVGKGDECCAVHIRPAHKWSAEQVQPYLDALRGL